MASSILRFINVYDKKSGSAPSAPGRGLGIGWITSMSLSPSSSKGKHHLLKRYSLGNMASGGTNLSVPPHQQHRPDLHTDTYHLPL